MDLDNFIIGKTKERSGEGRFGKKSNSCLTNIERKMCKNKQLLLPKKATAAILPSEAVDNSCREPII